MEKHLNTDFASLRTLKVVSELGSFSLAATKLDVSQSTVSYSVDRLRGIFKDPLFVKTGRSVTPTQRCLEIVEAAEKLLTQYDALVTPKAFDPASAAFKVVFCFNYPETVIFFPRIMKILRKEAPNATIQVTQNQISGYDQIKRGAADILLSPFSHDGEGLYRRLLAHERFVCAVSKDSPYAKRGITKEEYLAGNHVVLSYGGVWRPMFITSTDAEYAALNRVVDLPTSAGIDAIVAGTDLIASVPELLTRSYRDVAIIDLPFDIEAECHMYWSARTHTTPHMRWVRDVVARAAREVPPVSRKPAKGAKIAGARQPLRA